MIPSSVLIGFLENFVKVRHVIFLCVPVSPWLKTSSHGEQGTQILVTAQMTTSSH